MAVNGLFTYEDLYAGRSPNRHHPKFISQASPSSSFLSSQLLSNLNIPPPPPLISDDSSSTSPNIVISTEDIESNTKLNQLADVIPFTYFYWLLVVLAILLTLTLITVFICYCRAFLRNYKNRRTSLPSFHRYRPVHRRVHTQNSHQSAAPSLPSLPTPPCPSKSLECLNDQLHRQDLDIGISPPTARFDLYRKEPLSTFASSTSNLNSALQSRLSARSSDVPSKIEQSYESQRASMELDDELYNDLLMIDTD